MSGTGNNGAAPWLTYHGVNIYRVPNSTAYFYVTSNIAIDADGAPNAYNPQNTGLDALGNAGYPHGQWQSVLVPDPLNPTSAYVQKAGDPFPGYFVAMTSLLDKTQPITDTHRYLDARSVPYLVFPGAFYETQGTGALGDLAMVRDLTNGRTSCAIVGDIGPHDAPLGEMAIGLAVNLGGTNPNPRNGDGAPPGPFQYVVFPGSRSDPAWPLAPAQMLALANARLAQMGGWPVVNAGSGEV
ncbi:MAG: hypothetical protein ABSA49_03960 [Rhizomicrobium sp.]|jgi:hypothetical protein